MPRISAGLPMVAPPFTPEPRPSSAVGRQNTKIRIAVMIAYFLRPGALPFSTFWSTLKEVMTSSREKEEEIAAMKTRA